jgi:hypothetical protein
MSAPLDQMERAALAPSFERALFLGATLAEDISSGVSFRHAHLLYEQVLRDRPEVPPENERTTFVIPETMAAAYAHCHSPAAVDGLYALIDVGAGTTNVTFFRYTRNLPRPVAFYASRTESVGADDIDRAVIRALARKYPSVGLLDARGLTELVHQVRLAKQDMDETGLRCGSWQLSSQEFAVATSEVVEGIWNVYSRAFGAAYAKEIGTTRWESLTLVLVGGGSVVPGVASRLKSRPRGFVKDVHVQPMELPPTVDAGSGSNSAARELKPALLAVGFGLSFHYVDVFDYWRTHQVEPIKPSDSRSGDVPDWW